jgi:hypothetical protein
VIDARALRAGEGQQVISPSAGDVQQLGVFGFERARAGRNRYTPGVADHERAGTMLPIRECGGRWVPLERSLEQGPQEGSIKVRQLFGCGVDRGRSPSRTVCLDKRARTAGDMDPVDLVINADTAALSRLTGAKAVAYSSHHGLALLDRKRCHELSGWRLPYLPGPPPRADGLMYRSIEHSAPRALERIVKAG